MIVEFWDHLKCLELSDQLNAVGRNSNGNDESMKLNGNKKCPKNEASECSAERPLKHQKKSKCMLHGMTRHTTDNCKMLQEQAECM